MRGAGIRFFDRVECRINQIMGNLFFRGVPISDIKVMGYKELVYWDDWHQLMIKAEKEALKK